MTWAAEVAYRDRLISDAGHRAWELSRDRDRHRRALALACAGDVLTPDAYLAIIDHFDAQNDEAGR